MPAAAVKHLCREQIQTYEGASLPSQPGTHKSCSQTQAAKAWRTFWCLAMRKQGLPAPAHLKALLKKGSRSNSANMLLAKPRPNILTTGVTIPAFAKPRNLTTGFYITIAWRKAVPLIKDRVLHTAECAFSRLGCWPAQHGICGTKAAVSPVAALHVDPSTHCQCLLPACAPPRVGEERRRL